MIRSDASTWNTKFIEHAVSIGRAWRHRGVDSYRAVVYVMSSFGAASTTCEAIGQPCGTELHNSGTHALIEYVNAIFNVGVQPAMAKTKTGIVVVSDFRLWKHTVPLQHSCRRLPRVDV